MSFLSNFVAYLLGMWHEFVAHVTHQEKKGATGFWHNISTYLVTIPVSVVVGLSIFTAIILVLALMVPIGHVLGYDLGSKFAKLQGSWMRKMKWRPGMWIPAIRQKHSARQIWTSINPAEDVFKELMTTLRKMEERGNKGEEEVHVVSVDKKDQSVSVDCWSKYKCLDVMDFQVEVDERTMSGCVVKASSSSVGVAPLILPPPMGMMTSMFGFWIPYPDHGRNADRLNHIRGRLSNVQLMPHSDTSSVDAKKEL